MKALEGLRPALRALRAYEPEPAGMETGLDANENPYAPPNAFLRAAAGLMAEFKLNRYPDPACQELIAAAANYYGVGKQNLLAGNGSDEFIASLFVAFGGEGKRCLLPNPTFSMYALCAKVAGWQVLEEELESGWELGQAFVERAKKERPDLIVLASPNNPTGNCFDSQIVDALLDLGCVVILDEAYAEFAPKNRSADASKRQNLISLRTLSKAFGLAGLRLGFLIGEAEVVAELNKLRLPYNVDGVAQSWGALALSMAKDFRPALDKVLADKPRLGQGLLQIKGLELFSSDANFFLFRHEKSADLHAWLMKCGLRLRRFSGGRLKNCLRISVGTSDEVNRCLAAFKEWKP